MDRQNPPLHSAAMPRKASKPKQRPAQGARLLALRKEAGLTQLELAELVGDTQVNISFWERSDKPPRSDVLPKMAKALGVSVDDLLRNTTRHAKRSSAPAGGQVQKAFDEVRKLPRRQQKKIIETVHALVEQYKRQAS